MPVDDKADECYLKSYHGKYLVCLRGTDLTLYMSPNQKDWETWRLVAAIPEQDVATQRNFELQEVKTV